MGSAASRNRYLSLNLVPGEINFFLENEKKKLLFFELEVSYFKGLSFLAVISTIISAFGGIRSSIGRNAIYAPWKRSAVMRWSSPR